MKRVIAAWIGTVLGVLTLLSVFASQVTNGFNLGAAIVVGIALFIVWSFVTLLDKPVEKPLAQRKVNEEKARNRPNEKPDKN